MKDGARSDDPAVQRQLDRLEALGHGGDRGVQQLEPILDLCAALGDPHLSLPPVFHLAGTNGKGSTLAFLRSALEAGGSCVHVFTSPHLVRFNERIRLGGALIDDSALAPLLAEVLDAVEANKLQPSFFEATTAAAFLAFSRKPADALLLETGMGGRFDATNIVPRPAVCGISTIGLDHQRWLGDTIEKIAAEKTGIAKPGVPLVLGYGTRPVFDRIEQQAVEAGATVIRPLRDYALEQDRGPLTYIDHRGRIEVPELSLGGFQANNWALATAMLHAQDRVTAYDVVKGGSSASWPGRMQRLTGRLASDFSQPIFVDGAHNEDAALWLARASLGVPPGPHSLLVVGILANRDPRAILAPFKDKAARLIAVPIVGHDSHDPAALASIADEVLGRDDSLAAGSIEEAFSLARTLSHETYRQVVVLGSLYLVGQILAADGSIPG
ncbi:bifunctional folylpolyglutamate synthase/dihydrofolate synthase [Sphingomicrobium arenosum]|uniref:bifunctional folylpolyglutamate synthase/dihydrofolate synthase n=1 Tax=Sphingomicrobium arenosum TaxID=2233861 RepID=UPI0022406B72|nr:bifunctional folylpolyglutamate synthase/dihydrofolate synthase [Sphingomicrobium arenosum]